MAKTKKTSKTSKTSKTTTGELTDAQMKRLRQQAGFESDYRPSPNTASRLDKQLRQMGYLKYTMMPGETPLTPKARELLGIV